MVSVELPSKNPPALVRKELHHYEMLFPHAPNHLVRTAAYDSVELKVKASSGRMTEEEVAREIVAMEDRLRISSQRGYIKEVKQDYCIPIDTPVSLPLSPPFIYRGVMFWPTNEEC